MQWSWRGQSWHAMQADVAVVRCSSQSFITPLTLSCTYVIFHLSLVFCCWNCLQCFDAVGWAAGSASGLLNVVCVCLCVCVLLHSLKTFFYTLSHTGIKNKNAVGRVFISLVYSVLRLRFIVFGYLTSVQCSWILDFCIDILYFSCLCSLYLCAAFIWRNKE